MIFHLPYIAEYVRSQFGQSRSAGFVSPTEIYRWANEGYRKYISKLKRLDEGFFEKFVSLNIATGNDGLIELPSTFAGVTLVEKLVNSNRYVPLTYKKRKTEEIGTENSPTGDSYLPIYSFMGNNLLLEPEPSANETNGIRLKMKYNPPALHTGTAADGAALTITLDSDADPRDDYYNDQQIIIVSGTGVGQIRTISDYVGSTKVATVSVAWTTQPTSNSVFSTLIDTSFPSEFHMLLPLYAAKQAFIKERSRGIALSFDEQILKDMETDLINTYESRSDDRRYIEPWEIE